MYKYQGESFVIQVKEELRYQSRARSIAVPKANLSPMRLLDRFRKILMNLIFSLRNRSSSSASHQRPGDRLDPPKTSCSSYQHYSPNSHYSEAIADCIEFFNKSSQQTAAADQTSV